MLQPASGVTTYEAREAYVELHRVPWVNGKNYFKINIG